MSASELYGLVVLNCRIEPVYFLDEMELHEVKILLKQYAVDYETEFKTGFEKARFTSFLSGLVQGVKAKTPAEFYPFSWEQSEVKAAKPAKITRENLEAMKTAMSASFENFEAGQTTKFNT